MFFIFGTGNGQKQLEFKQVAHCSCCGQYGHIKVFMKYTYFSLFFIPLFKWNKKYYVKMSCCGSTCELPKKVGDDIYYDDLTMIDEKYLKFYKVGRVCSSCGYFTKEDFAFCPKCGKPLQ